MTHLEHQFTTHLSWEGNRGHGTSDYATYGRDHRIRIEGKPDLAGSAHPTFHGDPERHNPEDFFLASIASCHMLAYLALCARLRISVVAYEDRATATLRLDRRGGGRFEEVVLNPLVTIADPAHLEKATELHEKAHELCFIASSCAVPILCRPELRA